MSENSGDYASVNGLEMYYEVHGSGERDAGWDGSGMSPSRLAILPGTTHYDIFYSPTLASTVAPFLDSPLSEAG